jgi:hypothetical protein
MLAKDTHIPIPYLHECFWIVPPRVHWRVRPLHHFDSESSWRSFNSRFAGRPAGTMLASGRVHICLTIGGREQLIYSPRIVWALVHGSWPADQLGHKNQNRADDQLRNLREATHAQNHQNRPLPSNNTSGVKGVSLDRRSGKWLAHIGANGRIIHLGYFPGKADAVQARKDAETRYHPFAA